MLLALVVHPGATMGVGADDPLARRSGGTRKGNGGARDAGRSSTHHGSRGWGRTWGARRLVGPGPWSRRGGALPVLTARGGPAEPAERRRPKPSLDWGRPMMKPGRRWRPGRRLVWVGAGGCAAVSRALAGVTSPGVRVSRGRWPGALDPPPGPPPPGQRGPNPTQGKRQRRLPSGAERAAPPWADGAVEWDGGQRHKRWGFSCTALGSPPGWPPRASRSVLGAAPAGPRRMAAFVCPDRQATPEQSLPGGVLRWSVAVTWAEARAHLGLETQRPGSDQAIARTTPVLLALCSLGPVLALQLSHRVPIPGPVTARDPTPEPTFVAGLAVVRQPLGRARDGVHPAPQAAFVQFPQEALALCLHGVPVAA